MSTRSSSPCPALDMLMECLSARVAVTFTNWTKATEAPALHHQLAKAQRSLELSADLQRYFRDVNVAHQHAALQPNSAIELYGRLLVGLEPNTELV
jgi:hypothetical protein